jgi:hypothetical protein
MSTDLDQDGQRLTIARQASAMLGDAKLRGVKMGRVGLPRPGRKWWMLQGLNLRPPRCERGALPLS